MKSQCENTALLDAFVDGELSADDAERLKAHLADLLEWKNLTLTGVYGAKPVLSVK